MDKVQCRREFDVLVVGAGPVGLTWRRNSQGIAPGRASSIGWLRPHPIAGQSASARELSRSGMIWESLAT